MANYVLYIPGVSDHKDIFQQRALKSWDKFNLDVRFIKVNWYDNEPFKDKLKRIIQLVDELSVKGSTISLVAASAGCSMAINVYQMRKNKINSIVFICGKMVNPNNIQSHYKRDNPSFLESVIESDKNIKKLTARDKEKILTIHPLYDEVVNKRDGIIAGARNETLVAVGHAIGIISAISIYKRVSINFIKAKSVQ
jgi:predicted peptidase